MVTSSRAAIAAYLSAMIRAFAPDSVPGRKLAEWLRQHQRGLRLRYDDALRLPAPSAGLRIRLPSTEYPSAGGWATLADDLQRTAKTADDGDRVGANLAALASALGLSGDELEVFRFVFETDRDRSFDWLCTTLLSTRAIDTFGLIAAGTQKDATAVWSCLSGGTLGALQLVKVAVSGRDEFACFVPPRIRAALVPPNDGLADVERHPIGAPLRAALALDSFDHLKTECDFMLRLLRSAVDGRKAGVNILLHGRPGTGKTEFCKTLAAALDCDLFAVGEQDEWGGEPERGERLEVLQLADRLAARRGRTILLFDEMQDLLPRIAGGTPDAPRNGGSKIFLNRILEQNRVPMLWTSNDIDDFDPAFIRRMHYVLEMKPLPLAARVRMLSAVACSKGVAVPAAQADALARRFRVAPGIIGSAIEAAALAGGGVADVEFAADALARSVEGASPRLHRPTGPFVAA